jgi:glucokinase
LEERYKVILAGDIGGTNARLALFDRNGNDVTLRAKQDYRTVDFKSLDEVIQGFLSKNPGTVEAACFGVAGPVLQNKVTATNLAWAIDGAVLAKSLALKETLLLNDLVSYAYGALAMKPEELVILQEGKKVEANRALIAAGTGLGEGGLLWYKGAHLPVATEGGHSDFAPIDDTGVELYRYLRAKFGRVSNERVICGTGLKNIYEFLRDTKRAEEPAALADELKETKDVPALISKYGMAAKYPICEQALDIFFTYYGAEAGNIALKFVATGGMYIGGGIAVKTLERLKTSGFMKAFTDKGRFRPLLEGITVAVINNEHAGLIGAAKAAAAVAGR